MHEPVYCLPAAAPALSEAGDFAPRQKEWVLLKKWPDEEGTGFSKDLEEVTRSVRCFGSSTFLVGLPHCRSGVYR